MDQRNEQNQRPRYTWPWFVLGLLVLGLVLAVVWMTVLVRRTREQRELMWPQSTQSAHTNVPGTTNAPQ